MTCSSQATGPKFLSSPERLTEALNLSFQYDSFKCCGEDISQNNSTYTVTISKKSRTESFEYVLLDASRRHKPNAPLTPE